MILTSKHIPALKNLRVEIDINWSDDTVSIERVWGPMPLRNDCDEVNVTDLYTGSDGKELSEVVEKWFDDNCPWLRQDYLAERGEDEFDLQRENEILDKREPA